MVWLYKCSGDFKSCDGSGKKWFKVRSPYKDHEPVLIQVSPD